MYHIEVLPNSTSALTPGWTYVPDRGFDPAQAAITPAVGRKRGIREPAGRGDLSSRENNAIIRHLAELDRENHRDVQIPIPVKQKDAASRGRIPLLPCDGGMCLQTLMWIVFIGTRGKVTSNVRRILQSQKTFRNHLDDEEAHLSQIAQTTTGITAAQRPGISNRVTKPAQRRSLTPITTPKTDLTSRARKQTPTSISTHPSRQSETPAENVPTPVPADSAAAEPITAGDTEPKPKPESEHGVEVQPEKKEKNNHVIKSEYDNDPLLRSHIPPTPSDRIMQALLSEPPLPYNASRAGPPITKKSPRFFCCICGYWGKIRCRNCHVRTCGLDCYKVHEDSRCGAFL